MSARRPTPPKKVKPSLPPQTSPQRRRSPPSPDTQPPLKQHRFALHKCQGPLRLPSSFAVGPKPAPAAPPSASPPHRHSPTCSVGGDSDAASVVASDTLSRAPPPDPPLLAADAANASVSVSAASATASAHLSAAAAAAVEAAAAVTTRAATSAATSGRVTGGSAGRRALRGDVRRVWNRRALEASGISRRLLEAFDAFTVGVPEIPTHMDANRNVPVRNMRQWITGLEAPEYAAVWSAFVDALKGDVERSYVAAWGEQWDHDLCRFILGVLVSEDQTKQGSKQSRQAVNNAIKRELSCPTETGKSTRSKTFRDLFRQKCKQGGVQVGQLNDVSPQTATPLLRRAMLASMRMSTRSPPASEEPVVPHLNVPWYEQMYSVGEGFTTLLKLFRDKRPSVTTARRWLERQREACPAHDEWGRTAWWEAKSDQTIMVLPFMLIVCSLHELRELLVDFRWMIRTFHCVDFKSGMRQLPTLGYDLILREAREPWRKLKRRRFPPTELEGFRLIRNALMCIMPILAKDGDNDEDEIVRPKDRTVVAHFATQVVGRLLNHKRRFSNIASLIQSAEAYAPRPWLRPLTPCFQQPQTDVKLAVPSNGTLTPHLIALSEDGSLLATSGTAKVEETKVKKESGKDGETSGGKIRKVNSIEIWDVERGRMLKRTEDVPSFVTSMAIARDNSCVMAATSDGLHFWPLRNNDGLVFGARIDASPHPKLIASITPTVTADRALTTPLTSSESDIALWNTNTGRLMNKFSSVRSKATCVDVSDDGEYFASGHNNGFIHLWHMAQQQDDPLQNAEPVLSFRNEGEDLEHGQQHVVLGKANKTKDDMLARTISISFYEKNDESRLAAASVGKDEHKIRVWILPPRSIFKQGKTFVSSLRSAVLKCPKVRDVQWSRTGDLLSAGDDGIARRWSRSPDGKWKAHFLSRDKHEGSASMSSVLMSCGKLSDFVATYVTKSPYVTIWSMAGVQDSVQEWREREQLYKPFFVMAEGSVDATDIGRWTSIGMARMDFKDFTTTSAEKESSGEATPKLSGMSMYRNELRKIQEELERYFRTLDIKNTTKLVGDVQPRLKMMWDKQSRMRLIPDAPLKVCFEQPVVFGISGIFKNPHAKTAHAESGPNNGVKQEFISRPGSRWVPPEPGGSGGVDNGEDCRRGMVAALQDGSIGIFELEIGDDWAGEGWTWPTDTNTDEEHGVSCVDPEVGDNIAIREGHHVGCEVPSKESMVIEEAADR